VSRFWRRAWPAFYRLIRVFEPITLRLTRRFGLGDTVELVVRRRSGTARPILLGLLRVRGDWYVGHPNGECGWTHDLDRSPEAVVSAAWLGATTVRAVLLPAGAERSAAIAATYRQHPFPGSVLYWLARRHIRAVGRYYRLDVMPGAVDATGVSGGGSARGAY
jgi:hypothetical protein